MQTPMQDMPDESEAEVADPVPEALNELCHVSWDHQLVHSSGCLPKIGWFHFDCSPEMQKTSNLGADADF